MCVSWCDAVRAAALQVVAGDVSSSTADSGRWCGQQRFGWYDAAWASVLRVVGGGVVVVNIAGVCHGRTTLQWRVYRLYIDCVSSLLIVYR